MGLVIPTARDAVKQYLSQKQDAFTILEHKKSGPNLVGINKVL